MQHNRIYACYIIHASQQCRLWRTYTHTQTHQHGLYMHALTCSCAHTHMHARTRTHTLTQFSKELNSQSCIDEEQQHEEQTQIPHLDRHITRTHRYIQYMIHRKKDMYSEHRERRKHANREREATDRKRPYCINVYCFLKTRGAIMIPGVQSHLWIQSS